MTHTRDRSATVNNLSPASSQLPATARLSTTLPENGALTESRGWGSCFWERRINSSWVSPMSLRREADESLIWRAA